MGDLSAAETALITIHRESSVNDNVMLSALLTDWAALSTAHRAIVYKVADALRNAAAWRKGNARDGYPR
jgi:hypothetical protein